MNNYELLTFLDELLACTAIGKPGSGLMEKASITNLLLDKRSEVQAYIDLENDLANLPNA